MGQAPPAPRGRLSPEADILLLLDRPWLAVDDGHAAEVLKRLTREGYLEVVEKGSQATGLATTWRFKRPDHEAEALSC